MLKYIILKQMTKPFVTCSKELTYCTHVIACVLTCLM